MGFHKASFGIIVSSHNDGEILRLLYKEVIRYDLDGKELVDHSVSDFEIANHFSKVVLIPYDDYKVDGRAPTPIECSNDDELYDAHHTAAHWDNIEFINVYGCRYVLGFGSVGDDDSAYQVDISIVDMKKLKDLHDRLVAEGRISGGYSLVGNCCS